MTIFAIPEMNCNHCIATIRNALSALDPEARIEPDLDARALKLDTNASDAQVLMTLNDLGYAANVSS